MNESFPELPDWLEKDLPDKYLEPLGYAGGLISLLAGSRKGIGDYINNNRLAQWQAARQAALNNKYNNANPFGFTRKELETNWLPRHGPRRPDLDNVSTWDLLSRYGATAFKKYGPLGAGVPGAVMTILSNATATGGNKRLDGTYKDEAPLLQRAFGIPEIDNALRDGGANLYNEPRLARKPIVRRFY